MTIDGIFKEYPDKHLGPMRLKDPPGHCQISMINTLQTEIVEESPYNFDDLDNNDGI